VLDCIPTDTFILVIVYEHNGNVLLEYKEQKQTLSVRNSAEHVSPVFWWTQVEISDQKPAALTDSLNDLIQWFSTMLRWDLKL
jgi:hypothetical protein